MKIAVIGGDMRLAQLCILLAKDGHEVKSLALDKAEYMPSVISAMSAAEAVEGSDCVILPLPVAGQKGMLNTPLSSVEYTVAEIFDAVEPDTLVCGGRLDGDTRKLAAERRVQLSDYFEREELAVKNAVATAEGAIGLIMQETPVTIWKSNILVIGYGRIGKLLSAKLKLLGANVSVSARNHGDFAWIEAFGYNTLNTCVLDGKLHQFDVIVNTVPALVLDEARLLEVRGHALCIDLASKPGGLDFAAASRLGVRAIWALSLPGKVAPLSAGTIIRDTIYNIIDEQEKC